MIYELSILLHNKFILLRGFWRILIWSETSTLVSLKFFPFPQNLKLSIASQYSVRFILNCSMLQFV